MKIGKQSKKDKRGGIIAGIVALLLTAVAGICLYFALGDILQYKTARDEYKSIDDLMANVEESNVAPNDADTGEDAEDSEAKESIHYYPLLDIDFNALYAMNPDFVGVIYLPVLDIKYPIVKGEDNEEYLHKTFEGKNVFAGCVFMDYRNSEDFSDTFTFVYGHNMKDGSMFGSLKKFYQDNTLCDQDPYVYIYTRDAVRKYRIFSYAIADVGTVDIFETASNDEEYDQYIAELSKVNLYHTANVDLSGHPNVLTLYTCYGANNHSKKFLVHAAQVGQYRTATTAKTKIRR